MAGALTMRNTNAITLYLAEDKRIWKNTWKIALLDLLGLIM